MSEGYKLNEKLKQLDDLFQEIHNFKSEHPETKIGYYASNVGSILNAYREGDLTFDECLKLLRPAESLLAPPVPGDAARRAAEDIYAFNQVYSGDSEGELIDAWVNIISRYFPAAAQPAAPVEVAFNRLCPPHRCRPIARAIMLPGRDWWIGELLEPVAEWPLETHCLHMKTPIKSVVFLCNSGDFEQLLVMSNVITGLKNLKWLDSMTDGVRARAEHPILTKEEEDLVVGAIPLQALPSSDSAPTPEAAPTISTLMALEDEAMAREQTALDIGAEKMRQECIKTLELFVPPIEGEGGLTQTLKAVIAEVQRIRLRPEAAPAPVEDAPASDTWATMTQPCGYCGREVRHVCTAFLKTNPAPTLEADLDSVVREIFEITSSPYWDDRAQEVALLIKAYCSKEAAPAPVPEGDAPQMDWQQVVLNGGPPCFAFLGDEGNWFCGRAERWEGHDGEHKFISLTDLLTTERTRVAELHAALRELIRCVEGLADQQAMPDDFYQQPLDRARALTEEK